SSAGTTTIPSDTATGTIKLQMRPEQTAPELTKLFGGSAESGCNEAGAKSTGRTRLLALQLELIDRTSMRGGQQSSAAAPVAGANRPDPGRRLLLRRRPRNHHSESERPRRIDHEGDRHAPSAEILRRHPRHPGGRLLGGVRQGAAGRGGALRGRGRAS